MEAERKRGMALADGGKQGLTGRIRSRAARAYWVNYFLIPLCTILPVERSVRNHDGHVWLWILFGAVAMGVAIWRHLNLN
jgi:hypothetical protein